MHHTEFYAFILMDDNSYAVFILRNVKVQAIRSFLKPVQFAIFAYRHGENFQDYSFEIKETPEKKTL